MHGLSTSISQDWTVFHNKAPGIATNDTDHDKHQQQQVSNRELPLPKSSPQQEKSEHLPANTYHQALLPYANHVSATAQVFGVGT